MDRKWYWAQKFQWNTWIFGISVQRQILFFFRLDSHLFRFLFAVQFCMICVWPRNTTLLTSLFLLFQNQGQIFRKMRRRRIWLDRSSLIKERNVWMLQNIMIRKILKMNISILHREIKYRKARKNEKIETFYNIFCKSLMCYNQLNYF